MQLKHIVIACAVSCSFPAAAFAQQAPEGAQSTPDDQTMRQGQGIEQQGSQSGQAETSSGGGMEAKKQGAHSPPGTQQQYSQQTVREVQKKLNEEGYSAGRADGIWGPKTQSAVKNFQQKKGIEATGQLDEKTLAELDVEAQPMTGAAGGEGAQEGAGGATGAIEQPGQDGARQPSEQEAQQPGQSKSQ